MRLRSWEEVAAAQGCTCSETQGELKLDVLQPGEMARLRVLQYWTAPVNSLQSRIIEAVDDKDLDLIAAELQIEPDVDDTPDSSVGNVSLFLWSREGFERGDSNVRLHRFDLGVCVTAKHRHKNKSLTKAQKAVLFAGPSE